ncbi:Calycin-like protein [Cordyceps militaris CM01]|uniref:Calycin-like protein n=1 Tax=Cordyceps militaris (strain CM01) TaxID=983644 RepID=G3JGY8_CORMM|nr:Calycin-like protein [Cordyceps militaris CM01]EGX91544.1 Calycin-like protein [Cordyceps militaris CM01]
MKLQNLFLGLGATAVTKPSQTGVAPALWDGKCFYPQPDTTFALDTYPGRWYQLAGTLARFTAGCKCISARYDINDGSLYVNNTCQRGDKQTFIEGEAVAADEAYGKVGVLRVRFPVQPPLACDGPNYIVQEYTGDLAIVQSANFSNLFILSRAQHVDEDCLDASSRDRDPDDEAGWIDRAVELGTPREKIAKTDQNDCNNDF